MRWLRDVRACSRYYTIRRRRRRFKNICAMCRYGRVVRPPTQNTASVDQRFMPDFQHSVSVSVKTVSVQAVYAVVAGACARQ